MNKIQADFSLAMLSSKCLTNVWNLRWATTAGLVHPQKENPHATRFPYETHKSCWMFYTWNSLSVDEVLGASLNKVGSGRALATMKL